MGAHVASAGRLSALQMTMLEIRNGTPFAAAIFPGLDKEGYDTATVLVKGTFLLNRRGLDSEAELAVADAQAPLVHGDTFRGDPATTSVEYASDVCPLKRGTDVLVEGFAYPAQRGSESVDVSLNVADRGRVRLAKTVRAFGQRVWSRAGTSWRLSAPSELRRTALVYENAFGGVDRTNAEAPAWDERNPVGTGFLASDASRGPVDSPDAVRAPSLEDPSSPMRGPSDRSRPASLGVVGRNWMPRMAFGGTYDERWRATRSPFLPEDFDERFHQAAAPDQVTAEHLRGGEVVSVTNVTEAGGVRFSVPSRNIELQALVKGQAIALDPAIDTVLVEPELQRVIVSWRSTFRCPRSFLHIEWVRIREGRPS